MCTTELYHRIIYIYIYMYIIYIYILWNIYFGMYNTQHIKTGYILWNAYYRIYVTWPGIPKSEMAEYYIADLG